MCNFYNLNPNHLQADSNHSVILDVSVPLHNETFYELFSTYTTNPTESNQDKLGTYLNTINYLIRFYPTAHTPNLAVPHTLTINQFDDLHLPIYSTKEREVYLPAFTNTKELKAWCTGILYTLWGLATLGWTITNDHIRSLLGDISTT